VIGSVGYLGGRANKRLQPTLLSAMFVRLYWESMDTYPISDVMAPANQVWVPRFLAGSLVYGGYEWPWGVGTDEGLA